mgnify:CR=1 FL=1
MIQSFWHGKSLQTIYQMGTIPPNSLKEKFEDAVKHGGSSLSSNVQKLICESFVLPNDDITHEVSNKVFDFTRSKFELLDESLWREIESVLGGGTVEKNIFLFLVERTARFPYRFLFYCACRIDYWRLLKEFALLSCITIDILSCDLQRTKFNVHQFPWPFIVINFVFFTQRNVYIMKWGPVRKSYSKDWF